MSTSALTSFRSAVSKHVPAPLPVPVQVAPSEIVPAVTVASQWAPIACHTILPARRFRLF